MDVQRILSMSYETQHFRFHPRAFLDEIYNAFYENIVEALNQMKGYLADEYSEITTIESIRTSTDNLFRKLTQKLDKAIDKLEVYFENCVFNVPQNVALPEDEVHVTHPCTKEGEAKLDEEIEELKQKILKERINKAFFKSKISEQKWVKDELLSFKTQLELLSSTVYQARLGSDSIQITLENCMNLCKEMKQNSKHLIDSMDLDQAS